VRIAISTEGEFVSAHFGRCPSFTLVDISDGKTVKKEILANPGHEPGFIPRFLYERGARCIVCGGMGARATGFFDDLGIDVILGVSGKVEDAIRKLEEGSLKGGASLCKPGDGKGYGIEKSECDHQQED
jgi:predicted Fe-Mo cluster-binding NifX family protein